MLEEQGAGTGRAGGPFELAWGYGAGLCLMGLLLGVLLVAVRRSRVS
ncbi:hypothetical protein [Paractinoplanes atraurantiacus]|uniref:Uncharacterized protein n=1 Tax=Paractinoplanes atraurantiacus TaxID=1036182 RepID=A0A285JLG6_9ACTN|nr:hypothetical protein [Actinoplanes atraurantiacus]SNY61115.1 hypothetical protein SAMN05421748_12287 [Actinoplanes atraurantiacus]